jgi:hypothetical protein
MKRLLFVIFLIFTATSCGDCPNGNKKRGDVPGPPHGTPDNRSMTTSGEFFSISYIYNCHNGNHVTETYQSSNECSEWRQYTTTKSGICN